VLTGGYAAAQIAVERVELAGASAVRWSTVELFSGQRSGVALGDSLTLSFRNYLQVRGVQPGPSTLTLQLQQPSGQGQGANAAVIQEAQLLPGSGVASGSLAPPSPRVSLAAQLLTVRVGQRVAVAFHLASAGFPVRDAGLVLGGLGPGVVALDPPAQFLGWLADYEGEIDLLPLAPGRYQLTLTPTAQGRRGTPATLTLDVQP
jgi:hypothetical protein